MDLGIQSKWYMTNDIYLSIAHIYRELRNCNSNQWPIMSEGRWPGRPDQFTDVYEICNTSKSRGDAAGIGILYENVPSMVYSEHLESICGSEVDMHCVHRTGNLILLFRSVVLFCIDMP